MRFYLTYFRRYILNYPIRLTFLILGVTIAVVFVTFMGMLTDSIHATSQEKRYANYGEFQGLAIDITLQDTDSVESNHEVQDTGFSEVVATTIAGYEKVYLGTMDTNAVQFSRLALKEGELPKTADEIAIEDVTLKSINIDAKVGDKIDLNLTILGQEEKAIHKSFTLSGVFESKPLRTLLENSYSAGGTGVEHAVMPALFVSKEGLEPLAKEYSVQKNVLFTLNNKSQTTELITQIELSVPILMNALYSPINAVQLEQYDDTVTMDNYILIVFVILLAIIGIIQSFYITIQERERQLGILRALGAVRSQLRGIVFGEVIMISVISVPLGVILSIAMLKFTSHFIENFSGQPQIIMISPRTIMVSAAISVLSVICAALLPARKAMRLSPMKVISGETAVSLELEQKEARLNGNLSKKNAMVFFLAVRNLKRQKGRSLMMASVIMLTVFTSVFSYNYDKMLKLDWDNMALKEESYSYRIRTAGSGSKIGKVTLENGMNTEQLNLLTQESGVQRVNAYKQLNAALVGIRLKKLTDYYQDMPSAIVRTETSNDWSSEWIQQQIGKLSDPLQPVNFKVIGVSEEIMSELLPDQESGNLDEAIIYAPLPNSNYEKVDFQDMGLEKNDTASLVYYGNKGNQDFEVASFHLAGVINSLPNLMNEEEIFRDSICLIINENNFEFLTNESLFNDIYVYTQENVDYMSVSFDENIRKITGMGRKLFVESRLAKMLELNNESKILMLRLYTTAGVFALLTLFILFNVVLSSVFSRKRELGMLRAVGITRTQLVRMISLENGILCTIAGVGGIFLMFLFLIVRTASLGDNAYDYSIATQFPWMFSIMTIIAVLVVSAVVSRYALKKIFNQGIMDAIRYVE